MLGKLEISLTLRRGYTLVELMIVVVIIAILAVTAIPAISNSIGYEHARAAGMRIAADLDLARRQAVATGTPITVTFDAAARRYTLSNVPDTKTGSADTTRDLTKLGLRINSFTPSAGSVTFDRFGYSTTTLTIDIVNGSSRTTVKSPSQEKRCEVDS